MVHLHSAPLQDLLTRIGGGVAVRDSGLGGLAVDITVPLSGFDESPVGDLIAHVSIQACVRSHVEFWFHFRVGDRSKVVWVSDLVRSSPPGDYRALNIALQVSGQYNRLLRPDDDGPSR